nr:Jag N-terminal domain-containing protein [Sulfurospirillum arcachonense]
MRIEAATLEEAYSQAATKLSCSVTQISFKVIQNPSSGFLGMFKKSAIIEASPKDASMTNQSTPNSALGVDKPKKSRNRRNKNRKKEHLSESVDTKVEEKAQTNKKQESHKKPLQKKKFEEKKQSEKTAEKPIQKVSNRREYTKPKIEISIAVEEIRKDINSLFTHSCFELNEIKVEVYSEDTVLVEFGGEDAALLIGKEGYRYKSLSYLLYNWINLKYNLNVRLEIAEFLKNQEEMIAKYLVGVIDRINNTGRAQTKILDGVLVKIALEALRKEFPNKYVGIKSGREGGRFIVINDFNRKNT